jgi:hypothetical protein
MAVTVMVGGVDVTTLVDGGLIWEDQIGGRGQLRIAFFDEVGGFLPEDGQEILILENGVRRFGGMLVEPEEAATPANDKLRVNCRAVEFSGICDRRFVARPYTNEAIEDIVTDIVMQDLADEGISTTGVEAGPIIKKAVFNWVSVTEAFNDLAELTGMTWRIDENRVLQFRNRASVAAPGPLTNINIKNGTLRVRPDRQQYRNHQVLRAPAGLTDPRTESFVGDTERRTFNTAFKMGTEPTVTVNGVSKTVGIRQVETGKDWYWNKGATELSQDTGGTVLSDTDTLAVTYQGIFPIIISSARGTEILARQGVEGGSGRYTKVEERSNIETIDAAIAAAQAILDRYGSINITLSFLTDAPGYAPGQLVPLQFPQHNIDDDYLIESVVASVPPTLDRINYTLKCTSGDSYGGWQEYFRRYLKIGRQYTINENEVVVGLVELSDSATATESITTVSSAYPEFRVGTARVGYSVARAS